KFRIGVTLQKIERLDDWAMALVVGAKFQTLKDFGDHAAVMAPVGIADHRSQRGPIARARSLRLLDQVTQGLFADDRKNDVAHDPVRRHCHAGQEKRVLEGSSATFERSKPLISLDAAMSSSRG